MVINLYQFISIKGLFHPMLRDRATLGLGPPKRDGNIAHRHWDGSHPPLGLWSTRSQHSKNYRYIKDLTEILFREFGEIQEIDFFFL